MPKFFIKTDQIYENRIKIIDEDVNHIINVLRMKIGDIITICNSETGENFKAEIKKIDKKEIICSIIEKLDFSSESNVKITLFQGIPKFDKMEFIIQKATEIGVKNIVPVQMKRTIVKLNGKEENKLIRWKKIAEVAAKQSMRDIIPQINNIIKSDDILAELSKYDLFIIAYEGEKENTLKKELNKLKQENYNIAILIGPEGGIDKEEINKLAKYDNVKIVTLGKRILRTETAGLVMASNIIYELEE